MLGKGRSHRKPSTPLESDRADRTPTNLPGGTLADRLSAAGKISLSELQAIRLVCELDAFVQFMQRPALVGAAVLSGALGHPERTPSAEKNRTVVFDLTSFDEASAAGSDALQKAIYPLVKSPLAPVATSRFCIGRVDDNDLVMPDLALSKRHATIDIEADAYWLRDWGSTNGTLLNGQQIDQAPQALKDGDVVSFARYAFTFLFPDSLYHKLGGA